MLVSKALNRVYGTGRALSPIDFALVTNGAQWIIDEARALPAGHRDPAPARWNGRRTGGTAEPFGLTLLTVVG